MTYMFNASNAILTVFSYTIIGLFIYKIYKKQDVKPKIWKVILVTFIGIFSFTFNFPREETIYKIPILPLGVWILYWILHKREDTNRWEKYRSYAWLGFAANFLFLITTFLYAPLDNLLYPKDDIRTYIANDKKARMIVTHSSALPVKDFSIKNIQSMEREPMDAILWYEVSNPSITSEAKLEMFPYQLIGTEAKWGSGIKPVIYIERNGKGLLISTGREQIYFRSTESLLDSTMMGSEQND